MSIIMFSQHFYITTFWYIDYFFKGGTVPLNRVKGGTVPLTLLFAGGQNCINLRWGRFCPPPRAEELVLDGLRRKKLFDTP